MEKWIDRVLKIDLNYVRRHSIPPILMSVGGSDTRNLVYLVKTSIILFKLKSIRIVICTVNALITLSSRAQVSSTLGLITGNKC